MSQAFVRENDEVLLSDLPPSMSALIVYLTRENNGIRVYEKKQFNDSVLNRQIHVMSNGLSYSKDDLSKWYVI